MIKKYRITGLDCANCALELEREIKKIEGVKEVSINFMFETMEISYVEENIKDLEKSVKKLIRKEEPDVLVEEV